MYLKRIVIFKIKYIFWHNIYASNNRNKKLNNQFMFAKNSNM